MKVPIPCHFGEIITTPHGDKELQSVSWFKWQRGLEFTYAFQTKEKWNTASLYNILEPEFDNKYEIDDAVITPCKLIKEGYPILGKGCVTGLTEINGQLYADLILHNQYFAHVYVPCNENGRYIDTEKAIIVPPSWDTSEKINKVFSLKYKNKKIYAGRIDEFKLKANTVSP